MPLTTNNTSIILNGPQPGYTYIISVAAVNKLGTGSYTSIMATGKLLLVTLVLNY